MNRAEFVNALQQVLDTAMAADHAGFGNIQRVVPGREALEIVVQRGFSDSFLKFFKFVSLNDDSACGRAFRFKRRVVIADVAADPLFAPFAGIALESGFRAVQSTPIMGRHDDVLGVLSTHFPDAHQLSREAAQVIEVCCAEAAVIIHRYESVGRVRA